MSVRIGVLAVALIGVPALAASPKMQGRAPVLEAVTRCRTITVDADRLACFDASVAELDAAAAKRDVVVLDRGQVRETRRSLFGLSLPKLALFGGGHDKDEDEVQEITATLSSISKDADDRLLLRLEDGAKWRQIDNVAFGRAPRPGDTIIIHRAAMGSFKARVGSSPGFRVRREN